MVLCGAILSANRHKSVLWVTAEWSAMKVAIITGGSKGIGLAAARRLISDKWSVAICSRNEEELAAATSGLSSLQTLAIPADLSIEADCARVVDECVRAFGRLDALVNNAGIYQPGALDQIGADQWDETFAINVRGPLIISQFALPHLSERGRGTIVNIASTNGMMSEPGFGHYNASKAALISLTETMAVEWAEGGVRVNAIAPGWIETPLSEPWLKELDPTQIASLFPMGRVGTAEEVADLIAYLCAGTCGYLTGSTIRLDGGMLAKHPGI